MEVTFFHINVQQNSTSLEVESFIQDLEYLVGQNKVKENQFWVKKLFSQIQVIKETEGLFPEFIERINRLVSQSSFILLEIISGEKDYIVLDEFKLDTGVLESLSDEEFAHVMASLHKNQNKNSVVFESISKQLSDVLYKRLTTKPIKDFFQHYKTAGGNSRNICNIMAFQTQCFMLASVLPIYRLADGVIECQDSILSSMLFQIGKCKIALCKANDTGKEGMNDLLERFKKVRDEVLPEISYLRSACLPYLDVSELRSLILKLKKCRVMDLSGCVPHRTFRETSYNSLVNSFPLELKELTIEAGLLSNGILTLIAQQCPTLKTLHVKGDAIPLSLYTQITDCKQLEVLYFDFPPHIPDQEAKQIADSCRSLRIVTMSKCSTILVSLNNQLKLRCHFNDCIKEILENRSSSIQAFLANGGDINETDSEGRTFLHAAAEYQREKIVEELLQKGANCNHASDNGFTPLHYAVYSENFVIMKALISAQADLHSPSKNNMTPLSMLTNKLSYKNLFHERESLIQEKRQDVHEIATKFERRLNNFLEIIKLLTKQKVNLFDLWNTVLENYSFTSRIYDRKVWKRTAFLQGSSWVPSCKSVANNAKMDFLTNLKHFYGEASSEFCSNPSIFQTHLSFKETSYFPLASAVAISDIIFFEKIYGLFKDDGRNQMLTMSGYSLRVLAERKLSASIVKFLKANGEKIEYGIPNDPLIAKKLLAHFHGISDHKEFCGVRPISAYPIIATLVRDFRHKNKTFTQRVRESIANAIEESLIFNDPDLLIRKIQQGLEPVILSLEFQGSGGKAGHSIAALFYNQHLFICDKATSSGETLVCHPIDPMLITVDDLECFLKLRMHSNGFIFYAFLKKFIAKIKKLPDPNSLFEISDLRKHLKLKKQKMGNCVTANIKPLIFVYLVMYRVLGLETQKLHKSTYLAQKEVYKGFTKFICDSLRKMYLTDVNFKTELDKLSVDNKKQELKQRLSAFLPSGSINIINRL